MSGHSKWSTIKHKKAANDAARGKLFSNLSKAITIAAKTGGGPDPDSNYKLRVAIDQAKAQNMPKQNIQNAINKASSSGESLEEILYEGFGPKGVGVLVEVVTDNKNRTAQEIKNVFERGGGSLGGPGSASFNFAPKSAILIKKIAPTSDQLLTLIDLGIEEYEEVSEGIEAFADANALFTLSTKLTQAGFEVLDSGLIQKPKTTQDLSETEDQRLQSLILDLEENEDVQNVFTNASSHDK